MVAPGPGSRRERSPSGAANNQPSRRLERHFLIFDPDTLLHAVEWLDAESPLVIANNTYLVSEIVPTISDVRLGALEGTCEATASCRGPGHPGRGGRRRLPGSRV